MATTRHPAKFTNRQHLQQRVDAYFTSVGNRRPTVEGLTLFLGFSSRRSLSAYSRRAEFTYTLKRALLRIEAYYEQLLPTSEFQTAIVALQAMGWKDEVTVSINVRRLKRFRLRTPLNNH